MGMRVGNSALSWWLWCVRGQERTRKRASSSASLIVLPMARVTLAGAANVDLAACPAACFSLADSGLLDDTGPRVELVPSDGGGTASRGMDGPEFLAKEVCGDQGSASGSCSRLRASSARASVLVSPIGCDEGVPFAMAATAASAAGLAASSTDSPELLRAEEGLAISWVMPSCAQKSCEVGAAVRWRESRHSADCDTPPIATLTCCRNRLRHSAVSTYHVWPHDGEAA